MTNRRWYDDSNGHEGVGGMQGNKTSLPVITFFLFLWRIGELLSNFFCKRVLRYSLLISEMLRCCKLYNSGAFLCSISDSHPFITTVYQQPLGFPTRGYESLPEWHSYRAYKYYAGKTAQLFFFFSHGHSYSACLFLLQGQQEKQNTLLDLYLCVLGLGQIFTCWMCSWRCRPDWLFPVLAACNAQPGQYNYFPSVLRKFNCTAGRFYSSIIIVDLHLQFSESHHP